MSFACLQQNRRLIGHTREALRIFRTFKIHLVSCPPDAECSRTSFLARLNTAYCLGLVHTQIKTSLSIGDFTDCPVLLQMLRFNNSDVSFEWIHHQYSIRKSIYARPQYPSTQPSWQPHERVRGSTKKRTENLGIGLSHGVDSHLISSTGMTYSLINNDDLIIINNCY